MSAETADDNVPTDNKRRQYEEWDQAHKRMKEQPPKDGHTYLRHARNLLPLLESLAELHPIAKAVVFSFRAVINFQHDRIENDVRVSSVFLAQTDMMRVILEIHDLSQQRGDPSLLSTNETLEEYLFRIQGDIKDCGNAIDTYYKETRLVKFFKSQEWKQCMMDFNQTFINHRIALSQILSVRVARGVDDLRSKIDLLLNQVFTPQRDWEKSLRGKLRQYGPKDHWINDPAKVQQLIKLTDDPFIDPEMFPEAAKDMQGTKEAQVQNQRMATLMASIKEEIGASLDVLCQRNWEVFEQKMNFHTAQLQEAISNSAAFIVRQLAGPYDRLRHEDLRKLWKEMNWIFCVEDKLFAIALFEYYLDYFHTKPPLRADETGEFTSADILNKRHEDLWTLEYLASYGKEINAAVDHDLSGFIRISEVNMFTDQIPQGWTLPQWCVYVAVGWEYELHIYQKRLEYLLDRFYEGQHKVLPGNRFYTLFFGRWYYLIHELSRGPTRSDFSHLPETFRARIREKVKAQDELYRGHFKTFKYHIDAEDTLHLLYGSQLLESYILQLCVLLTEHCLDILGICESQTIDIRDWLKMDQNLINLRNVVHSRLKILEVHFQQSKLDVNEELEKHHGGLFRIYYQEYVREDESDVKWTCEEVENRISDTSVMEDFPLPEPNTNPEEVLRYATWEAFTQDLPEDAELELTPSWGVVDNLVDSSYPPRTPSYFPWHFTVRCDNCGTDGLIEQACYNCCDCADFDLCADCFKLPHEKLDTTDHVEGHNMVKHMMYFPPPYRQWISALGEYRRNVYLEEHGFFQDPEDDSEEPKGRSYFCGKCQEEITAGRLFLCLHPDCEEYYLCSDCEASISMEGEAHAGEGEGTEENEQEGEGEEDEEEKEEEAEEEEEGEKVEEEEEEEEAEEKGEEDEEEKVEEEEEEKEEEDGTSEQGTDEGERAESEGSAPRRGKGHRPKRSKRKASPSKHEWWHTLLVLEHMEVDTAEKDDQSDTANEDTIPPAGGKVVLTVEDRISGLDQRMSEFETNLQTVDKNIQALKELILTLIERTG